MLTEGGAGVILRVDGTSAQVEEAADLRRLEVWSRGRLGGALPAVASSVDGDDDHVWLDISALRGLGGVGRDADWHRQFDEMIAYAASKGWIDGAGSAVRAHIVPITEEDGVDFA